MGSGAEAADSVELEVVAGRDMKTELACLMSVLGRLQVCRCFCWW